MYISPTKNKKYLEQWYRVKRLHEKVCDISKGGKAQNDEDCLDVIISFFMHCYHLRDWIEKSLPSLKNNLDGIFNKSSGKFCLLMCRDLAVGSKHLEFNVPTKLGDKNIGIKHQNVTIYLGSMESKYSWDVSFNGKKYDVYTQVEECVKEWKDFMIKNSLL